MAGRSGFARRCHSADCHVTLRCAAFAFFTQRGDDEISLDYAVRHNRIIDRFGQFRHSNVVLGRAIMADEAAFFREPKSSF
jgi:uncharacterized protein (DUF924 family)